jgi:hypothetical protein
VPLNQLARKGGLFLLEEKKRATYGNAECMQQMCTVGKNLLSGDRYILDRE